LRKKGKEIMKTPEQMREGLLEPLNRPILKALDSEGVDDTFLVKKLKEELEANTPKFFQREGKVIQMKDCIAWEIRQRARQDAHKLRGDYPSEKHQVTVESSLPVTQFSEEDRIEIDARKQILKEKALRRDAMKK
jgi:hypothetical protein